MKSTLARLEALEAATGAVEDGPLTIYFGCDEYTDPRPRPAKRGDTVLCVAAGDAPPAWIEGRRCVYLPADQPLCTFRTADGEEWSGPRTVMGDGDVLLSIEPLPEFAAVGR